MAVDKKSQHVGNHGGRYTDLDGQSKQFTYIDHDKKTKIGTGKLTEEEIKTIQEEIKNSRNLLITTILSYPPSLCPFEFVDFTVRGDKEIIRWNETMVRDAGLDLMKLMTLKTLLENRAELQGLIL